MNKTLTVHDIKNMSLDNLIASYKQGYRIKELQTDCNCTATCNTGSADPTIPGEITTCQKTGKSGWATCDALGYMCIDSTCPGGCSDPNTGAATPSTTLPPVSVPPPSTQCGTDQFSIPLIGCQSKYKVALVGGIGAVALFLLAKRGEP